jgi:hypothetical protein
MNGTFTFPVQIQQTEKKSFLTVCQFHKKIPKKTKEFPKILLKERQFVKMHTPA